jgi:hypothetical protein
LIDEVLDERALFGHDLLLSSQTIGHDFILPSQPIRQRRIQQRLRWLLLLLLGLGDECLDEGALFAEHVVLSAETLLYASQQTPGLGKLLLMVMIMIRRPHHLLLHCPAANKRSPRQVRTGIGVMSGRACCRGPTRRWGSFGARGVRQAWIFDELRDAGA